MCVGGSAAKKLIPSGLCHFPNLALCEVTSMLKYKDAIVALRSDFNNKFQDFKTNEHLFRIFSTPFSADVEKAPSKMQMELTELQCNTDLEEKLGNTELLEFYLKYIVEEKFPVIRNHALFIASLFDTTYMCEQLFSKMKNVKSKVRNRLTDTHLQNSLGIASSDIKADTEKSVKKKQCQVSH